MKVYVNGSKENEVLEILESFQGNLYFRTDEIEEDGTTFGYVRLYSMPDCAEWGCFNMNELKEVYGKNMIWPVKKINWKNINSYEENLLEMVE